MAFILPHIGNNPDESFSVSLDGDSYRFRLKWNTRDESWTLYAGFNGQSPVMSSKLTIGLDLLDQHRYKDGVPKGNLFVLDIEKTYGRPDRNNTGIEKRFRIMYIGEDEVIE